MRRTAVQSSSAAASASGARSSTPQVRADEDRRIVEYTSKDDVCPVCSSDRYMNSKLRLLVSPCYHRMCESCIQRIFGLGPEPCPVCGQILRRAQFTTQTFENLAVQREVQIRNRIARCFNKREQDFKDSKSYDDYLEEVEEITFNLLNSVDLELTEAKIRAYESANRDAIKSNKQRNEREKELMRLMEEEERRERDRRRKELETEEEQDRQQRERERQRVIDELERSDQSAANVLSQARKVALKRSSARLANFESSVRTSTDLRFLSNLADSAKTKQHAELVEEPLAMLEDWYAYDDLYDLEQLAKDVERPSPSGSRPEEAIDKAVREAVASLWL